VGALAPEAARDLVYDLEVHRTELEIQNEELRHLALRLELARDRFKDHFEFAPVGYAYQPPTPVSRTMPSSATTENQAIELCP
jgi:hypothetical protein